MLGLGEASIPNGIELSDFLPGEPDLDEWSQTGDCRGKACVVSGPDIEAFPALLYATPVVSGGSRSGLRGLLVDITFQKELEKQVIESQKLEALGRLGPLLQQYRHRYFRLCPVAQKSAAPWRHGCRQGRQHSHRM